MTLLFPRRHPSKNSYTYHELLRLKVHDSQGAKLNVDPTILGELKVVTTTESLNFEAIARAIACRKSIGYKTLQVAVSRQIFFKWHGLKKQKGSNWWATAPSF